MKNLLAVIIVLLSVINVKSQDLAIIPKAGASISNVKLEGQQEWSASSIAGFTAGIALETAIIEDLFFCPEILFMRKGSFYVWDRVSADDEYTRELNYIDIPLLLKYKFGDEKFRFFGTAGPYVSFLLGGNVNDVGPTGGSNTKDWEADAFFSEYNYDYSKLDLGIDLGAGFEIGLNKGALTGDIRYGLGFIDVANADLVNTTFKDLGSYRILTMLVGYRIEL